MEESWFAELSPNLAALSNDDDFQENLKYCIEYKERILDILERLKGWSHKFYKTSNFINEDGTFSEDRVQIFFLT